LKSEDLIVAEGAGFTKRGFRQGVHGSWWNFAGFEGIEGFGVKSVGQGHKSVAILFLLLQ
jgi:hypothetical protein